MMNEENDLVLEERWGVGSRTLLNWREKGVEVGDLPPLGPDDGESFLDWYRAHYGREPSKKVKSSPGVMAAREVAAPVDELDLDLVEVEVLKGVLSRLGLSLNLSRVIEEVERAYSVYVQLRAEGKNLDSALRRWKDGLEIQRQLQKGDDAVSSALELLKMWMRKEWEPKEAAIREGVSGAKLGRAARSALVETTSEAEWVKVWDREVNRVLVGGEEVEGGME